MSVTTFFSTPGVNSPIDSWIETPSDPIFANVRGDTVGAAHDESSAQLVVRCGLSGGNFIINRSVMHFDTSSLPDGDVVSACDWQLKPQNAPTNNADSTSHVIVGPTDIANDADIVNADIDNALGADEWSSRVLLSSMVNNVFSTFTGNAAGIAAINLTGLTRAGIIDADRDFDNLAPTGKNDMNFDSADQTGTADDPILTVTHAPAAPAIDVVKVGRSPGRGILRGHLLTR